MITAPELARRIADQLEHLGVPYAVGGSLALAVWGFPRATNDVDIDLFVDAEGLDAVLIVLRDEGMTLDIPEAKRSAAERGDFRGYVEGMRIDFFVPCIPLYESARDRVRVAPLLGRPARFLSAEDLATFKMLFFRSKDIVDIERLVAFGAGNSIAPTSDRGWCKPSARRTNASADGTAWCGTSNRAVHSSGVRQHGGERKAKQNLLISDPT